MVYQSPKGQQWLALSPPTVRFIGLVMDAMFENVDERHCTKCKHNFAKLVQVRLMIAQYLDACEGEFDYDPSWPHPEAL